MPIYSFRCADCGEVSETMTSVGAMPASIECEHCKSQNTRQIITGGRYHASEAAKTARLDPKYEKLVDNAMRSTTNADPDRLLRRMKPFNRKS